MMTPQERYESDASFYALVETMKGYILQAQFTPSEIREAALLAAIHLEYMTFRGIKIPCGFEPEIEKHLAWAKGLGRKP